MINPLLIFRNLYKGRTDAYGLHDPTLDKEYKTVRAPVTTELYNKHLEGQHSLGFIPITPDGKCSAGFVDDDSHKKDKSKPVQKYDYNKLLHKINSLGLPVVVTKSKSGGAHIGLFFDKPYPAKDVRHMLKKVAYQLCDGTPEIFPKQEQLQPNETGSFINLPYHRGNTRVIINNEGTELNFNDGMLYAANRVQKLEDLVPFKLLAKKDFPDGRNNKLWSAALFFKKHYPNDYEKRVEAYNKLFPEPLPDKEVTDTVLSSIARKDYTNNPEHEELPDLVAYDVRAYLNLNIPKPLWILPKLIQERSINFLFGEKGKGKTEFSLGLAFAICMLLPFLHYPAPDEETPVTVIDGEMDPYDLVQRTTPYIERFGYPKKDYLQLINFALQHEQTIPDIKEEPGQELILKHLKKQELLTGKKPLLILDNLRSLSNYIENDADSYRPIGVWLKNLRGMGYTTLVIDHTGKAAPGPRGTSSKTDWANVCLKIEPDGPAGQKYMKVKLSFDKARGLRPNETADYVCQYDFEGNWTLAASTKELEDAEYIKQIKELRNEDPKITQKAIAEKLDIAAGKVNKLIKEINKEKKEDKVPF
jgi:hypothetical protein